jgi:DNA (cytosine-5)-methyltransferase 1
MNHVDLFSGIGGFALASRNVWGNEYNNVCFCEINKYAQAVLRKNFGKDVVICEDIRTLKAEQFGVGNNADRCGRVHGKSEIKSAKGSHKTQREPVSSVESSGVSSVHADSLGCNISECNRKKGQVLSPEKRKDAEDQRERSGRLDRSGEGNRINIDLLTGGFPCQPFSQAGQRRGTEDDRFLWPEMLRVISEFRPTWIIGENVAGLLSMAEFDGEPEVASETDLFGNSIDVHTKSGRGILFRIIGELEQIGYSVQTFVIPACAVNAPHRRDRVWIVAHRASEQDNGQRGIDERGRNGMGRKKEASQQDNRASSNNGSCGQDSDATHAGREHGARTTKQGEHEIADRSEDATELERSAQCNGARANRHANGNDAQGARKQSDGSEPSGLHDREAGWDQNWLEVATRFCGVDDGLPSRVDGLELSKAGHRVERLKALGNAIVPQVAEQIMQAIKEMM